MLSFKICEVLQLLFSTVTTRHNVDVIVYVKSIGYIKHTTARVSTRRHFCGSAFTVTNGSILDCRLVGHIKGIDFKYKGKL